jgi:hypothetical protein
MLPITLTKNSRILVHRKRVLTFFCPNANFKTHFLTGPKSGSALGASILFWCCNGATDFFNMYLSWWYCSHHVLIIWWCIRRQELLSLEQVFFESYQVHFNLSQEIWEYMTLLCLQQEVYERVYAIIETWQ